MSVAFWTLVGLLAYGYAGYGLLIIVLARFRSARPVVEPPKPLRITVLIAAHNEEKHIRKKLENTLSLDTGPHHVEVVVVSDGSTDGTVEEARSFARQGVRLIEMTEHRGKISAINAALEDISGDIVAFTDANSMCQSDTLWQLVRHLGDPRIGGVGGQLAVPERNRNWLGRGESLYWMYDQAMKLAESRLGGAVSLQGAIYVVRRELLGPMPSAVADDLIQSLRVVTQGKRLIFEPKAVAREQVSNDVSGEFRRRVRSTERGWRGLMLMSRLLNPFHFGFYSLQLFSHKVLRRLNPYLLVVVLLLNLILVSHHPVYGISAAIQVSFYLAAGLAWAVPNFRHTRALALPLFFVMGHVAMGLGVWNVVRGRHSVRWSPVR